MKKNVLMAILFTGISLASFGQENTEVKVEGQKHRMRHAHREHTMKNKTPEQIATIKTERLDKQLKFTDQQREQVYAIQFEDAQKNVAFREQMNALRENYSMERKGSHDKLNELLDADQKQVLASKFKGHRDRKTMRN